MPIDELIEYAVSNRRYSEEISEEISNYGISELLKYVDYPTALTILERAQEGILRAHANLNMRGRL